MKMVRSSALGTGRLNHSGDTLVLISVRGWVDLRAVVRPGRIKSIKQLQWHHRESNPRPLSRCINQLGLRVTQDLDFPTQNLDEFLLTSHVSYSWSEVKGGGGRDFMENVFMSSKVVRSEGLGWKREYNICGGKILETIYNNFYLCVFYLLYMLYFKMSCVYCC